MLIDHPASRHIHQLRQLWKTAFGDTDAFLDSFFRTAFACDRCRCVLEADTVAAVLYWFDCVVSGQKTAYIYAVATHPDHRGQGLCRRLMADTHALLKSRGYASAILVPQKESLRKMYAGMGYRDAGGLEILECTAGASVPVRAVGPAEFAQLRRQLLPEGSVIQEGENLVFLSEQLRFFAGDRFLLAAYEEKGRKGAKNQQDVLCLLRASVPCKRRIRRVFQRPAEDPAGSRAHGNDHPHLPSLRAHGAYSRPLQSKKSGSLLL